MRGMRLRSRLRLGGGGGCFRSSRRRRQIGLGDPAGLEARLHDHRLGVLARQLEAVENAGLADGLAVLAFGPAGEIVGGATGEILDRLDAVLAEPHQHRGGDAGHLLERVLDAEFLALGVELGLDLGEIFAGAGLQFGRGVVVEALDAGDFLGIDHRQFLDRVEAFRRQQLADHLVDIERSMNMRVRFSNSAWRRSDSSCSVRMSMSQPVSCEASRTFWPRRPIASESC